MQDDETDMTEADEAEETTDAEAADSSDSLVDQLEQLEKKQAEAAVEQLDATIADLAKLIEDAEKADEDYAEIYEQLKDDQDRLKNEHDTLAAALSAALGNDGVKAVKDLITPLVKAVGDAGIAQSNAKKALKAAQTDADDTAGKLEAAKANLDMWRKPGDSISKRLKLAATLVTDIQKLRNSNRRGEAYWKLALGGHADVPGQDFLHRVLSQQPEVIKPADLRERIEAIWKEFTEARKVAAKAITDLDAAKAAMKTAEADHAEISKNLITAITDALAEREAQ